MQFSTAILALATAMSVSAAPSAHANHARLHKRNVFKTSSNPNEVEAAPVAAAAVTPSSSEAAAAPTATASSGSGEFKPFCSGNAKRATFDQIMYEGNTGGKGSTWGCNMQIIDAAAVDKYDYTTKFSSTGGKFSCSCFNKVGPEGLLDGFWFSAVDFSVSEAGKDDVWMAFDTNSQGGCACSPGDKVDRTGLGQLAGTWLEFDWGSEPNGGNSGADASVLVAGAESMKYYGMSVAANGKVCSWVKSDGTNEAAYMPGMEDEDGIGCKGYHKGQLEVLLGDNFSH